MTITRTLDVFIITYYCFLMLFDMLVTVIVMYVFFYFFIVRQFLDNECSITLQTVENNKICICQKRSHPCTITSDFFYIDYLLNYIGLKLLQRLQDLIYFPYSLFFVLILLFSQIISLFQAFSVLSCFHILNINSIDVNMNRKNCC